MMSKCIAALLLTAALPTASAQDARKMTKQRIPDDVLLPMRCVQSFDRSGTIRLPVGYSGSVAEFNAPGKPLRVVGVTTRRRSGDLHASALGTTARNSFAWHRMQVASGSASLATHTDKVYADANSLIKIEANRSGATNAVEEIDYTFKACVISRIPPRLQPLPKPDDVPRLPQVDPGPRQPVEVEAIKKPATGAR